MIMPKIKNYHQSIKLQDIDFPLNYTKKSKTPYFVQFILTLRRLGILAHLR